MAETAATASCPIIHAHMLAVYVRDQGAAMRFWTGQLGDVDPITRFDPPVPPLATFRDVGNEFMLA